MKAKEFLQQVKKLDYMIENKMVELQHWKSMACSTGYFSVKEKVQTSSSQQKMAEAVEKYVDIEREINACIDNLVDTKRDIINDIERLSVLEYDVLHKCYIQGLTLKETAVTMNKSYQSIVMLHGVALKNVQEILDEREEY